MAMSRPLGRGPSLRAVHRARAVPAAVPRGARRGHVGTAGVRTWGAEAQTPEHHVPGAGRPGSRSREFPVHLSSPEVEARGCGRHGVLAVVLAAGNWAHARRRSPPRRPPGSWEGRAGLGRSRWPRGRRSLCPGAARPSASVAGVHAAFLCTPAPEGPGRLRAWSSRGAVRGGVFWRTPRGQAKGAFGVRSRRHPNPGRGWPPRLLTPAARLHLPSEAGPAPLRLPPEDTPPGSSRDAHRTDARRGAFRSPDLFSEWSRSSKAELSPPRGG